MGGYKQRFFPGNGPQDLSKAPLDRKPADIQLADDGWPEDIDWDASDIEPADDEAWQDFDSALDEDEPEPEPGDFWGEEPDPDDWD